MESLTWGDARYRCEFKALGRAQNRALLMSLRHILRAMRPRGNSGLAQVNAMLTVPNGVPARRRRAILGATYDEFERRIIQIARAVESALENAPGARPVIAVVQQRCPFQRAEPIVDADIRFDPRTAVETKLNNGVRRQAVAQSLLRCD